MKIDLDDWAREKAIAYVAAKVWEALADYRPLPPAKGSRMVKRAVVVRKEKK